MKKYLIEVVKENKTLWIIEAESEKEAQAKYNHHDEGKYEFVEEFTDHRTVEVLKEFED